MAQGNSINDEIKEQKKKFKELSFTENSSIYGNITGL